MAEKQSVPRKDKRSPDADAARMAALFAGNDNAHGTHGIPVRDGLKWEIKSTAKTLRESPTMEHWIEHLAGKRPLGIIPIRADGTCWWGSIDVDQYDVDLLVIVNRVEQAEMPLVPCVSKSGGLHLFMFAEEPVQAQTLITALREMAAQLGLANCEIFPKQTQLSTERGEVGNWMVMPYYGDTFDGRLKRQAGLKKTGAEQTLGEFLITAEDARASLDVMAGVATRSGGRPPPRQKKGANGAGAGEDGDGWFSDGPPCLEHLAIGGFPEGGRNSSLFMAGVYLRKKYETGWQEKLEEYNRALMRPPLTADEVTACVRSLQKREYQYTCRSEPMVRHCHSAKCRLRPHGVGETGQLPIITSLTMYNTDPVIWMVDVADKHIEVDTETLQNYTLFHRACMHHGVCFAPLKQSDWWGSLSRAFASAIHEPAPPDTETDGQFRELVEDFCTNMQRGDQREDLLSGRPWEESERHYFRLRDLQKFLEREKFRNSTRGWIAAKIRKMGGAHHVLNIKGRTVNVWWVPVGSVQETPEIPTPKSRRGEQM
jgi:hypothetical protein